MDREQYPDHEPESAERPAGELPEPLAQEWDLGTAADESCSARDYFEQRGLSFNGREWLHLVPLAEPIEETGLAMTIDPLLLFAARHITGAEGGGAKLGLRYVDTTSGSAIALTIQLPVTDKDGEPLTYHTVLNPTSPAPRQELTQLAGQSIVPIDFLHPHTGEHLDRWHMPLHDSTRALLTSVLSRTEGESDHDPKLWPWAALLALGATYKQ